MISTTNEAKQDSSLNLVKKSYLIGFFASITIVVCSLLTAFIINHFFDLSKSTTFILQAFSVVPEATAIFGLMGWKIQTWSGATPPEILNKKLFNWLSAIGLFLLVTAFAL